jgi:predicted nucleotidyltransferase
MRLMMIDEQTLQQAVRLLLDAAPGARVILFGSHARNEARPDSDLDFLVIEPEVEDRMGEMVRLSKVLAPLMIPTDVLVVSAERFEYWKDTPNTVYHRAVREGRVYGQVA